MGWLGYRDADRGALLENISRQAGGGACGRTGEVVVDDDVDALDVDPAAEEVRAHQQPLLPVLEGVVPLDAVFCVLWLGWGGVGWRWDGVRDPRWEKRRLCHYDR